ncbi:competence/damage-inducible protein A [Parabacteroides pacaensis]|uniref:competence/damage-inducible protein A n=1 Tax=Parabacteroides pacaensis TaxID=2086575 RepID=UPI000D0FE012|nr:competence/damage-inducible protein A [Parabacteroides pacaensis]
MNVEIITIGDELLIGQVVDTNSAWMGQVLGDEGFHVVHKETVGDVESDILQACDEALKRSPIVLVTGGIGPTKDDITKKTLCKYFNTRLCFSEEVLKNIEDLFQKSGKAMNPLTHDQAYVPEAATVIQNRVGTAPITWFERDGKILVSFPGVPYEMKWAMKEEILPRLKKRFRQDLYIKHQTLWVSGYTESALAMQLETFEKELPSFVTLAYLPTPGLIRLRLSAYYSNESAVESAMLEQSLKLRDLLKGNILAEEDKPIQEIIGEVLRSKKLTLGTAESCTGGKIAEMITAIPGSSDYFVGGIVSYSNNVKHQILDVSNLSLDTYGAVSQQVVEEMVMGALKILNCDCAVATSGVAGPGGGTPEKPVGTVWIAAAWKDKIKSQLFHFGKNREQNILRSANMALLMLNDLLKEEE